MLEAHPGPCRNDEHSVKLHLTTAYYTQDRHNVVQRIASLLPPAERHPGRYL